MSKEQLCWTCQRACGGANGCEWSNFLRPVKKWIAIEVTRKDGSKGYRIVFCPKYIKDGDTSKKKKTSYGVCACRAKGSIGTHLMHEEKELILTLRKLGLTYRRISAITNISISTISRVVRSKG